MNINTSPSKSVDFSDFSIESRKAFLLKSNSEKLLSSLPEEIKETLINSFINNVNNNDSQNINQDWFNLLDYFFSNSKMVPESAVNPGTFTMLDRMYWNRAVIGSIDNFFYNSKAGDSLRNRLNAVSNRLSEEICALHNQSEIRIIDLGSGPGDYPIEAIKKLPPNFNKIINVDCFEIDSEAIKEGKKLVNEEKLNNFNFYFENMITYRKYIEKADIGLLIGILCPLKKKDCIKFLRVAKRFLKPGGKLIAATLLDKQLKEDLFPSYLAKEISGWNLDYKPAGLLEEMFLAAGFESIDTFADEPTKFYDICVGTIPK
jgi:SAM-dependent methyltransferase